ncbi:adenylate/guanylate cyclase domain-containing protein [uncultured Algibacter sp.]|uniref:adenylate/guanylate cyclase domain-containing protein n=1 Tax=uncultured Algibacter sp. TaxID=298659 RepID=UPI002607686A|nr:adenylate/guanylate cyclase domain-containing protein [uncultured Algibacter sp.]
MILHSKHKRQIRQIIAFGIIWLMFGFVYVLLEFGLIGRLPEYPSTGNKYSFLNSLISVSIGSFLMGLIIGCIEALWLKKYFERIPFWKKILFKSIFYLLLIISFIIILTLINNALYYDASITDPLVINSLFNFFKTFSFWVMVIYTGLILDLSLFYSEIEAYLGNGIISNYMGKYHKPKQEIRIFMFLDMKASTSIAEKIGHKKYFDLLKTYYADMTEAILDTNGEVYQYVGDEIVVSWDENKGLSNNNCLQCFNEISKIFNNKKDTYLKTFGLVPEFKAGFHIGEVTTGEIGIIKKNIFYIGDVLNTTARIQAECNNHESRTLISEKLKNVLQESESFSFLKIEKLVLRGKKEAIQLYDVTYH